MKLEKDSITSVSMDAEITYVDSLLEDALTRLDSMGRFDVGAHVDLALHHLRGTRNVVHTQDEDNFL
jgi:hypothetical protein